ncbi:MAG: SOS response-associated peptidase [Gammaproteobacteria bacterium]|nr:SOS response-associated peptidase [Gammaproteobacteria bacterium]
MCGRYTFSGKGLDRFEAALDTVIADAVYPRYNIAPDQGNPVILKTPEGIAMQAFRWGLVPHWLDEPKTKYSTINAKVETVAEKPFYRDAYKSRRCLVPADGYYEWRQEGVRKQPYYIHQGGQAFAFAGLWDRWEGNESFSSYTIITGPAAETVRDIHARMPLVLPEASWKAWLDPETPVNKLPEILDSAETKFEYHVVSTRVNDPRNEGPELIEPHHNI